MCNLCNTYVLLQSFIVSFVCLIYFLVQLTYIVFCWFVIIIFTDVMHDVLEGALQYEVKLMLQVMFCFSELKFISVLNYFLLMTTR